MKTYTCPHCAYRLKARAVLQAWHLCPERPVRGKPGTVELRAVPA